MQRFSSFRKYLMLYFKILVLVFSVTSVMHFRIGKIIKANLKGLGGGGICYNF